MSVSLKDPSSESHLGWLSGGGGGTRELSKYLTEGFLILLKSLRYLESQRESVRRRERTHGATERSMRA